MPKYIQGANLKALATTINDCETYDKKCRCWLCSFVALCNTQNQKAQKKEAAAA